MNDSAPSLQVEFYASPIHPGRYGMEISGYVDGELQMIADRLEEYGYEVRDADQWGRLYRHVHQQGCLAELEESDEPFAGLRLCLSNDDLPGSQAYNAIGELYVLYLTLTDGCLNCYPYRTNPCSREPTTAYAESEVENVGEDTDWLDLDPIYAGS